MVFFCIKSFVQIFQLNAKERPMASYFSMVRRGLLPKPTNRPVIIYAVSIFVKPTNLGTSNIIFYFLSPKKGLSNPFSAIQRRLNNMPVSALSTNTTFDVFVHSRDARGGASLGNRALGCTSADVDLDDGRPPLPLPPGRCHRPRTSYP